MNNHHFIVVVGCFVASAMQALPSQASGLPHPPGARMVTLPRAPNEKPQETAVAVNPRNPDNVIVSYHQSLGSASDHHPNARVSSHVAWSVDG